MLIPNYECEKHSPLVNEENKKLYKSMIHLPISAGVASGSLALTAFTFYTGLELFQIAAIYLSAYSVAATGILAIDSLVQGKDISDKIKEIVKEHMEQCGSSK